MRTYQLLGQYLVIITTGVNIATTNQHSSRAASRVATRQLITSWPSSSTNTTDTTVGSSAHLATDYSLDI